MRTFPTRSLPPYKGGKFIILLLELVSMSLAFHDASFHSSLCRRLHYSHDDYSSTKRTHLSSSLFSNEESSAKGEDSSSNIQDRRNFLHSSIMSSAFLVGGQITANQRPLAAHAADQDKSRSSNTKSLESSLYTILRVREATEQETRLIKSGKFKDVQRANVKLACRFMLQNYRLADNFIAASTYLEGNRRYQATDAGQAVVQALQTILEYFDSSDVQNLKVGSMDNMAGKEYIVINGLEAARNGIDRFLAYFPEKYVDPIKQQISEENALNEKEFDSDLGVIINLRPVKD